MRMHCVVVAGLGFVVGLACQAPPQEKPAGSAPEQAAAEKPTVPAAVAAHAAEEGCGEGHAAAEDKTTTGKDPETGETLTYAGAKLNGAQKVTVSTLLAQPQAYAGKTVRLEGNVTAMCHHKRGWFALQEEGERGGTFVRVITTPRFLVPAGTVGKKARVEGTVEVIEEGESAARHYAEGHKLGDSNEVKGPQKRVILRASGAAFL